MTDRHTRTERSGVLSELGKSILAIPIGALLFAASFGVIWFTEGRTDQSKICKQSAELGAEVTDDDGFVSVSGPLTAPEPLGDPEFLAPGPWLQLERRPEMWAWVEHRDTETRNKIGGGKETITYFEYRREWTAEPQPATTFDNPTGHENPPMYALPLTSTASEARVGAWSFDPREADLAGGEALDLTSLPRTGAGATAKVAGHHLHLGRGDAANPILGDVRVSFNAVPTGVSSTVFGQARAGSVGPYVHAGETRIFRLFRGSRGEALVAMHQEYVVLGWLGRLAGFVCMWLGLSLFFAPLHAVLGILPFLAKGSRFLVGLVLLPVALLLTAITTVVSMILHSFVAALLVALTTLALLAFWMNQRRKASA